MCRGGIDFSATSANSNVGIISGKDAGRVEGHGKGEKDWKDTGRTERTGKNEFMWEGCGKSAHRKDWKKY